MSNQKLQKKLFGQKKRKFKTEICRNWTDKGMCEFGDSCLFAHGEQELRAKRKPKNFKTENCKSFMQLGYCTYGHRCLFKHPLFRKRLKVFIELQKKMQQNTELIVNEEIMSDKSSQTEISTSYEEASFLEEEFQKWCGPFVEIEKLPTVKTS